MSEEKAFEEWAKSCGLEGDTYSGAQAGFSGGFAAGYWQAIEECAYVPRMDGKGKVPACMGCGERLRVREQGRKKK